MTRLKITRATVNYFVVRNRISVGHFLRIIHRRAINKHRGTCYVRFAVTHKNDGIIPIDDEPVLCMRNVAWGHRLNNRGASKRNCRFSGRGDFRKLPSHPPISFSLFTLSSAAALRKQKRSSTKRRYQTFLCALSLIRVYAYVGVFFPE